MPRKSAIIELDNGKRLPVGVALGIVDVVGCRPMTRKDLVAACCEDYEDEMYGFAWELANPREVVDGARQRHRCPMALERPGTDVVPRMA